MSWNLGISHELSGGKKKLNNPYVIHPFIFVGLAPCEREDYAQKYFEVYSEDKNMIDYVNDLWKTMLKINKLKYIELSYPTRLRNYTELRYLLLFILHKKFRIKKTHLVKYVYYKEHSSVVNGLNSFENLINVDNEFFQKMQNTVNKIDDYGCTKNVSDFRIKEHLSR